MTTTEPSSADAVRTTVAHPSSLFPEFLGLIVRPKGGWAPVSAMVALMSELGFEEPVIRAMVSRQKSQGWLVAEKRGRVRGYRLGPKALEGLTASDEYVWHPREPAPVGDGWVLVTFSVPESARAKRHLLRSRLAAIGFGTVGPGVLIAPARMAAAAEQVLRENDLARFADVFMAQLPAGADPADLLRRGWDLSELDVQYRSFVEAYGPVRRLWAARPPGSEPDDRLDAEAFRDYAFAFNRWRRLPLEDPGLPADLLGPQWAGRAAGELFEDLVALLRDRAIRHASRCWPA